MAMLDIDSDTSTVVPFGNTLVQVNCGVGSPVAVQLRAAGAGERTSTSMGSPSRVTETMDEKFKTYIFHLLPKTTLKRSKTLEMNNR